MYQDSNCQMEMIEEIKVKRELMIRSANTQGYTSELTIKYSQELDELINRYHRMMGQALKTDDEVKFAFKQMIMVYPKVLM